jgi:hypothetical protein
MIRKFCIWYLRVTGTPVLLNLETIDCHVELSARKGPVYLSSDTGKYDVAVRYKSRAKVHRYD